MDLTLDEAESTFLQAILTGAEGEPELVVARGLEVPAGQQSSSIFQNVLNTVANGQGDDAVTVLKLNGLRDCSSYAHQGVQLHDKHPSYFSLLVPHHVSVLSGSQTAVPKGQPWQQDIPSTSAREPSPIRCFSSLCQDLPSKQPSPSPPLGQAQQPHEPSGYAPSVHALLGTTSAFHTVATAGPDVFVKRLQSIDPLSAPGCCQPAGTQSMASTCSRMGNSLLQLPTSNSAISTVSLETHSEAATLGSIAATSTFTTGHHRQRSLPNPGGTPRNSGVDPAGSSPNGSSSSSRGFSSTSSIPNTPPRSSATAIAVAAPAVGRKSASAGAATTTVSPVSLTSRRAAQGLLQRIQDLEMQLTKLLLEEGVSEEADRKLAAPTGKEVAAAARRGPRGLAPDGAPSHVSSYLQRRPLLGVYSVAEQLCHDYNNSGVALMEAGLDEAAREQLDKALLLAGPNGPLEGRPDKQRELQIVAHNNLACYYRKVGKPALALQHLQHTARLEGAAVAAAATTPKCVDAVTITEVVGTGNATKGWCPDAQRGHRPAVAANGSGSTETVVPGLETGSAQGPTAATLLNMAACCSSLGQHVEALSYANRAVKAAAGDIQIPLASLEAALLQGLSQMQLWEVLPQMRRACQGATTQLAMAYYNRAVEQEHLHHWQAAMESYKLAVNVASRFVGRADDLTQTLQQSAEAFKVRLRKLERQGKVRPVQAVSHGSIIVGSDGIGSGGAPSLAAKLPINTAANAGAVSARQQPHLRPLLRCATVMSTSTPSTNMDIVSVAATASASFPIKKSRNLSGLPAIIPLRQASTPTGGVMGPPSDCGQWLPTPSSTGPISPVTWAKEAGTLEAALPPRRALSAGWNTPTGRLASATLSPGVDVGVGAGAGWPMVQSCGSISQVGASAAAAGAEATLQGGGVANHMSVVSCHSPLEAVAAAIVVEPRQRQGGGGSGGGGRSSSISAAAAVLGGDLALRVKQRSNLAWSPPLPPKPRPEAGGDARRVGGIGSGSSSGSSRSGSSRPELSLTMGVIRSGRNVRHLAGELVEGGGAGELGRPPAAWSLQSSGAAPYVGDCELQSSGPQLVGPPTPALPKLQGIVAIGGAIGPQAAAHTGMTAATLATVSARAQGPGLEDYVLKNEGSLAAVAAEAIAAAAELAQIFAAGEDGDELRVHVQAAQALVHGPKGGQGQGPESGQGLHVSWPEHRGLGHKCGQVQVAAADVQDEDRFEQENGRAPVRVTGSTGKQVPTVVGTSPPAQKSPAAGICDALGRSGDVCRKGNSSPSRLTGRFDGAVPGSMLVPKRDGVVV